MSASLWLVAVSCLIAVFVSALSHHGLRRRASLAVFERLEKLGRQRELRWLSDARERLGLATAALLTLASLSLTIVILALCEHYGLKGAWRYTMAVLTAFFVVAFFGVALPAAIAKHLAGAVMPSMLPLLRLLDVAALPLWGGMTAVERSVRGLAGVPERAHDNGADELEKEILNVVSEGQLHGTVDQHERDMIESIMQFGDARVDEIMTPRTDIVAIEHDATFEDARALVRREGHSRIPVFDDSIDNVLGVLYAKDLLLVPNGEPFDIKRTMRKVPLVPWSKPVDELLGELRDQRVHIAIVLDEYGGTAGLVTIEDILEELVGEIEDEYEPHEPAMVQRVDDHTVDVDARMRVDELNEALDTQLPEDDDYDTIGGFVFTAMGRIPTVGEGYDHGNVHISVIAAEPRRIKRLRLQVRPPPSSGHGPPGAEAGGDNGRASG